MSNDIAPLGRTSYTPSPGDTVLATYFEGARAVHAVVAPGEEQRDELKLCYLVAEEPGKPQEVIGELFYEEDTPYATIRGLDADLEPVRFKSRALPTLVEVTGKSENELQRTRYAYHQGWGTVEEARDELIEALEGLLCRYVAVETYPNEQGLRVEVAIHIDPDTHACTSAQVADEQGKWDYLNSHFVFVFLDSTAEGLLYGMATPAGFFTAEHLTAYELLSPDVALDEFEAALELRLDIQRAHDQLVAALREQEEGEEEEEVNHLDSSDGLEDFEDVDVEVILELLAEHGVLDLDDDDPDMLRAANPETGEEELMALLLSADPHVREAVIRNPSLSSELLYSCARYGHDLDTRLVALREFRKRERV